MLSALPYLALWVLTVIFSPLSDYLINNGHLSVSIARKLFNSIGHWIPMITLIGLAYTTNTTLAIILLTTAVGISAGTNVGFLVNHIDLSPNFAGTLMAITNSIANVPSIFAPLVAGAILNVKNETKEVRDSVSTIIGENSLIKDFFSNNNFDFFFSFSLLLGRAGQLANDILHFGGILSSRQPVIRFVWQRKSAIME